MATVHREANWGARAALTRRPVCIDPIHIDDIGAFLDRDGCPTIEVAVTLPEARNVTIIAVTVDSELRAALAEAIPRHALRFSDSAEQVLAGSIPDNCAVLIAEQSLGRATFERLKSHIKKSAPAVVDILIGTYDDGGSLVRMLAAGQIDRFMVKPLNPGPTRTALRSALQQHHSLRSKLKIERPRRDLKPDASPAVHPNSFPCSKPAGRTQPKRAETIAEPSQVEATRTATQFNWRSAIAMFAGAAVIALMGLGAWLVWMRVPDGSENAVVNKVVADHLSTAQRAFELGSYVDPPGLSAVHFYNAVLELDPSNARAHQGLEKIVERLMEEGKRSIADGDLLRAQSMLDTVRRMRPNHPALSAVTASLLNARDAERQTIQAALTAAAIADEAPALASPSVMKKPVTARPADIASANKSKIVTLPSTPAARAPIARDAAPRLQESLTTPHSAESNTTHTEERAVAQPVQVAVAAPVAVNNEAVTLPTAAEQSTPRRVVSSPSESVTPTAIPAATAPSTLATTLADGKLTLIKYVPPVYPAGLRGQKAEGWMDVNFVVTSDGRVVDPQIKNGTLGPKFHRAAFDAVTQWKFSGSPNGDRPNQPVVVHLEFRTPK